MIKRAKTDLFKVNGVPLLAPDEEMEYSYEDIDSADAGRDEAGYMHRILVRAKVGKWSFSYSSLSEEEYNYMERVFGEVDVFQFTHPSRKDSSVPEVTECYRSKYSIAWKSAVDKTWNNYKFNIIEC